MESFRTTLYPLISCIIDIDMGKGNGDRVRWDIVT